jgi:dihydroorotate dehydrogenase
MSIFPLIRPFIFMLEAETAHQMSVAALRMSPFSGAAAPDPVLNITVAGLNFPNPVGLAAGYDKNAEVPRAMLGLGFGFVEVGTLTPEPQAGNPAPRLFRLAEDRAVINRMGFNNEGQKSALPRLIAARRHSGVIGVNIGANKDSVDRIADYVTGVEHMAGVASYLTVNISSPNTPGLRALQDGAALAELLQEVRSAMPEGGPPVFLKLAPDLDSAEIDSVVKVAMGQVDGLIISNTTISRPPLLSGHRGEAGGLSGAPLKPLALQRLIDFRAATGGQIPLIAAGGIENADDAYARIRAGASLIQIYSALVYEGPGLARRIAHGLRALLIRDGFAHVADAVGIDAP